MSVFETIGIANGHYLFFDEHLAKLSQACALTGLRLLPFGFNLPPAPLTSGVARVYITAGDGSPHDPTDFGRIILLIEDRPFRERTAIKLAISDRSFTPLWPGIKTGNYWPNIAASHSHDEIVLLNAQKHVVSASTANLFAVIDDILMTPRPATGARLGVIRDWVTDRTDVVLSEFHPEQLAEATEIFLTNSGYGVGIVSHLGKVELPEPKIGPRLLAEYRKYCGID